MKLHVLLIALGLSTLSSRGAAGTRGADPPLPDASTEEGAPGAGKDVEVSPAHETRIEFEYAAGRSFLGPGPLARLELQKVGGRDLITFGERRWPVSEALFLRFPDAPEAPGGSLEKGWTVLLRNGDTLRARIARDAPAETAAAETNEDDLGLLAPALGETPVQAPLAAITALIAETGLYGRPGKPLDYPQAKAQLIRRLRAMKVEEDVVLLRRTTEASGPQGAQIEGIVEKLTDEGLTISSDRLGAVEVSYERLKALVLAQLEDELAEDGEGDARDRPAGAESLRVQVRLRDGSDLSGRLESLGSARARVHHDLLGEIDIRLEHVAEIAFLGGRVTYLSDREPTHVREFPGPLFNETDRYGYKRDTNVLHGPLRMAGRSYRKGLGVHSYSLLEYALAEDDSRFQATIGLDDSARPFSTAVASADVATVVFRVKVDGKLLFEKAMSWKDAPVPIEVPVKGEKLSLEVDFGGVAGSMNSTLDRANWADARLLKSPD